MNEMKMVAPRRVARILPGLLAGCLLTSLTAVANAQGAAGDGRFYLGAGVSADFQDLRYDKSVYRGEDYPEGPGFDDSGSSDKTGYGAALLAGYRWSLPGREFYLSGELDAAYHGGVLRGALAGTGQRQGDVWPENWSLDRNYSYGLTLRLGRAPGPRGVGWHLLAGARGVDTDFTITEIGCPDPFVCPPDPLVSGTVKRDRTLNAWTIGAGLERALGANVALQLEARYTDYLRKSWNRLWNEGEVVIPSALEGDEVNLSLRLLRYF